IPPQQRLVLWRQSLQDDEDAPPFPRLGGGTLPKKNTPGCPANCTCPSEETVECGGLDLHVFPGNVSRAVQHLSLQVTVPRPAPRGSIERPRGQGQLGAVGRGAQGSGADGGCWTRCPGVRGRRGLLDAVPRGQGQMGALLPQSQRPVPLPLGSKLKSLEYLDLSNNNLTEIPAGFPPNIMILHLGKNRIGSLPRDSLSRVRGLQYLLLQNNRLTAAGVHPDAFLKLRSLHTLHLYNNRLERVPPGLPRRVRSLMILHNQIAHIGLHDFANTYLLAELNLSYNRLYSAKIHRLAFRKLRRLQSLDLSGNQLTLLPAGLPPSLEVLTLHKNQINSLSPELLANLSGLKELHLAHNRLRIGAISPGTWQELQGLKLLDLSNNELSYIPPDLPESLEYLYLQHNRIAVIGAEAFHTILDIRAIVLRSNRLLAASVSDQAFVALKQLEVVDTTGNPEPISVKLPRAGRWLRSHPGPRQADTSA
uniref:Podocan-like protein 1 n=1 Tax=Chelydra serpentina TaxID=8475 RepID=A0A8C3TC09_CHESE